MVEKMSSAAKGAYYGANASKLMIDGEDVHGATSLDFSISRSKEDIHSIDTEERMGAYYGALKVTGSIKVRSAYEKLDKKMYEPIPEVASFQMVVQMFPQGGDKQVRQITFDDCVLEEKSLAISSNGVAETTYKFSATRVREDLK
jgi:hypothetical protein